MRIFFGYSPIGSLRIFERTPIRVLVAAIAVVIVAVFSAFAHAGSTPIGKGATFRDPANDVAAADLDLISVSLAKRDGNLIVRFSVRGPVNDNVRYTADIGVGVFFAQVVAERTAGNDSFTVVQDSSARRKVTGSIKRRTITVTAPISTLQLGTMERFRAYFWSQPTGNRWNGKDVKYWSQPVEDERNGKNVDWAPQIGKPVALFCLSDPHPRPRYGPCIWPTPLG